MTSVPKRATESGKVISEHTQNKIFSLKSLHQVILAIRKFVTPNNILCQKMLHVYQRINYDILKYFLSRLEKVI